MKIYVFFEFHILLFKEFENLSVEKKALSTALGFEPRSFDCRSTAKKLNFRFAIVFFLNLKKHIHLMKNFCDSNL